MDESRGDTEEPMNQAGNLAEAKDSGPNIVAEVVATANEEGPATKILREAAEESLDVDPRAIATVDAINELNQIIAATVSSGVILAVGAGLYWIVGIAPLRYAVFLGMTYLICLQIFRFTTYHHFFSKAAWVLVGYAIIVGLLLNGLGLANFFIWHLIINAGLFGWKASKESRARIAAEMAFADDPAMQQFVHMSMENTRAYYWLSVAIYLGTFAVSFVVAYNA